MSKIFSGLIKGAYDNGVIKMSYKVSYILERSSPYSETIPVSVDFEYPEQASNFATAMRSSPTVITGTACKKYTVNTDSIEITHSGNKVVY